MCETLSPALGMMNRLRLHLYISLGVQTWNEQDLEQENFLDAIDPPTADTHNENSKRQLPCWNEIWQSKFQKEKKSKFHLGTWHVNDPVRQWASWGYMSWCILDQCRDLDPCILNLSIFEDGRETTVYLLTDVLPTTLNLSSEICTTNSKHPFQIDDFKWILTKLKKWKVVMHLLQSGYWGQHCTLQFTCLWYGSYTTCFYSAGHKQRWVKIFFF